MDIEKAIASVKAAQQSIDVALAILTAPVPEPDPQPDPDPEPQPEPQPDPDPQPDPEPVPPPVDANIILTGEQGYKAYRERNLPKGTLIDASAASFTCANCKNDSPTAARPCSVGSLPVNQNPITIEDSVDAVFDGGTINGLVPMNSEWKATYVDSAAIRFLGGSGGTVRKLRMDRVWDAVRFREHQDFTIERVHASNIRDDAIENDWQNAGTIRDSLFDGALNGLSTARRSGVNSSGSGNTILFERVLMRLQIYNQGGEQTHGTIFKADTDGDNTNPQFVVKDSIFAIETVHHNGMSRLKRALQTVKATNSYYLNLSDTPLPGSYPDVKGAGFIVLEGKAARDKWAAAKAAFA